MKTTDLPAVRRSLGALLALSAAICVYAVRQVDPDLYGYLAYGRLYDHLGHLPSDDPFAYTSAGMRWVTFEYLAQLALWRAFALFGPAGLIALKMGLGGAAILLLWIAIRSVSPDRLVRGPVFILATTTVSRYLLFRPQLFTFACFALFVAVLLRRLLGRRAPLWILPPVMVVWANTHGGFAAGLGAIGLALILAVMQSRSLTGGSRAADVTRPRTLAVVGVACLAATLLNPHGIGLWRYVLTELAHDTNRRFIVEWQPTSWSRDGWSAMALTVFSIALLFVTSYAERHRQIIAGLRPWQWALSSVPLLALAWLSVRHVPLAALWVAPVIALLASAVSGRSDAEKFRSAWLAMVVASLVSLALTVQYVIAVPRPVVSAAGTVLGPTHPCSAMAFMRAQGLEGHVYAPLWWGSYLTWHLYPRVLISMDGRNISLFPDDMVVKNLQFYAAVPASADLEDPLRYDTDFLLVPTSAGILSNVRSDGRWREMFADRDAALFVRAGARGARWDAPATAATAGAPPSGCPSLLTR